MTMKPTVLLRQTSSTPRTLTSNCSANTLWLPFKGISPLLSPLKTTPLLSEFVHRDCGELRCRMVFGFILVNFVDGDDGVHNTRLDGFLVDHGLNTLMDMMMNMFPNHCWSRAACVLRFSYLLLVLELRCLRFESLADVIIIAMFNVTVFNATHLVCVRLGQYFFVLDGLDGGVVMVLVDFTIHGCGDIFMACGDNVLMLDGRVDGLD